MIPLRLTLQNFLSYHQASLDFSGLQLACICGPNGAGKSSLLEAMAWAVWGQSRAINEDDLIHSGQTEAQVDFVLEIQGQCYRIIRTRRRNQATYLEFQARIEATANLGDPSGFRSLTGRSLRQTQARICQQIHLDYETFINSAYLRQGRADEFMLKRPAERKQLLADLLKLDHYETLAEAARDSARQYKGQLGLLGQNLSQIEAQLTGLEDLACEKVSLEQKIRALRQQLEHLQAEQQKLTELSQSRQLWQQQLTWANQQQTHLQAELTRQSQSCTTAQAQLQKLHPLLQTQAQIQAGYGYWQHLQTQDRQLAEKATVYRGLETRRQNLQQALDQASLTLHQQLQTCQSQLTRLEQQQADCLKVISKETEIEAALQNLHTSKAKLHYLDDLQNQAFPLLQLQRQLELEQERAHSRLVARMDELRSNARQLQQQQAGQPQLQQAVLEVTSKISHLQKQRVYLQHLQDKGLERRRFMEQLQDRQRDLETQLGQLEQKMQLLTVPDACCPLCDRPLDELHWALVKQRHEQSQQDLLDQIWVIREQLAVSEREIQVLRREYREVDQELSQLHQVLEQRGRLEAQLGNTTSLEAQLHRIFNEIQTLESQLQQQQQAQNQAPEWQTLTTQLAALNYDEKTHALARGEVERWRWAEAKQAELNQARRQLHHLEQQLPALITQQNHLQTELKTLTTDSDLAQELQTIQAQLDALDYDPTVHHQLQAQLRDYQPYLLQWQELTQAQARVPQLQQTIQDLTIAIDKIKEQIAEIGTQITHLHAQLHHSQDTPNRLKQLAEEMNQAQTNLETHLAHLGRLSQQQQQHNQLQTQLGQLQQQQAHAQSQLQIYQELAQAFGQNGIPALMIENLLPQLEAEANHLLGRLTGSQLHVQFVTQKAGRGTKSVGAAFRKEPNKLIDTLDILIADTQGTRPYETYSGGEAFRVNFAIRLALSRLLARQSGSELQLLIIDEGFGTQDQEGCERLIAALNSIAPDFACILAITHMPQLQAAFQTRIAVTKTTAGSQLTLIS
ncbi:AAA family ATPase [Synechococcus sp. PCC 6312]|uniref:AAA family ATPase n=1 Tax=Synechococcus sp. (strain ATCC 27167 / PCC 6312) TaxID=195253 RepID=UPI00029F05C4|nr:SMC family ATPase [Synechococcus sp. PCC 6312]AFY60810.1 ATPase involved in DNA repair [Synechococcus sp. PCC 6312]